MMHISAKGDYGLRAVLDLCLHDGEGPVLRTDIAARQNIPAAYLVQLLNLLRKAGLVHSIRGPKGGHVLLKRPDELTVEEVLAALEGPVNLVDKREKAEDAGTDVLNDVWEAVGTAVHRCPVIGDICRFVSKVPGASDACHIPDMIMDGAKTGHTVLDLVGNTPMVKLNSIRPANGAQLWAKLEFFNPAGSVKDRTALAMVEAAEKSGQLKPGMTIVEPTSGNTGIGLAMVAAIKNYRLIITMPEGVSDERTRLLKAYGAEVVLTPTREGMRGAIEKAWTLKDKNCFIPMQFENPRQSRDSPADHCPRDDCTTRGRSRCFCRRCGNRWHCDRCGRSL